MLDGAHMRKPKFKHDIACYCNTTKTKKTISN